MRRFGELLARVEMNEHANERMNERTNERRDQPPRRALSHTSYFSTFDREGEANGTDDSSSTHFAGAGVTHEHDLQPFLGRVLLDVRHEGRGRWESCEWERGPTTTMTATRRILGRL